VLRQTLPPPTLLLAVGADPQRAAKALAEGADLIDVRAAAPGALAAIRASLPAGVLWTGSRTERLDTDPLDANPQDANPQDASKLDANPLDAGKLDANPQDAGKLDANPLDAEPLDADLLAARAGGERRAAAEDPAGQVTPAAVIATAAVCTWLGAAVIRSRHTRAVRRAIDMTASIAGHRPPSHTVRGLA
jgi:hypothetical protein